MNFQCYSTLLDSHVAPINAEAEALNFIRFVRLFYTSSNTAHNILQYATTCLSTMQIVR